MTRRLVSLLIVAVCVVATATAGERTLNYTRSAEGIDIVALNAGTGDLELIAGDGETIEIEITLTPRRGGFFSSLKDSEREVEQAILRSAPVAKRCRDRGGRWRCHTAWDRGWRQARARGRRRQGGCTRR
jgi:hypothetical protein